MNNIPEIPYQFDLSKFDSLFTHNTSRPLDPNGVDVYGEIPRMVKAYEMTGSGRNFGGRAEAGYSIFPSNNSDGHTAITMGPEANLRIPTSKDSKAVVHTHGKGEGANPSTRDTKSPIPNYVFSGDKLYVTIPGTNRYMEYNIKDWNIPALMMMLSAGKGRSK